MQRPKSGYIQRFLSLGCSVLGHQGSLEGNWVHLPIWIYNFLFASSLHARLRNISLNTLYGAVPTLFSGHIIIRDWVWLCLWQRPVQDICSILSRQG